MPSPVSRTTSSTVAVRATIDTSIVPPEGVNFTAFDRMFQAICWQAIGVGDDRRGACRIASGG